MILQAPENYRLNDGKPIYRLKAECYYADTFNPDHGARAEVALIRPQFVLNEVFTPVLGGKLLEAGLYVSPFLQSRFFELTELEYRILAHARVSILATSYGVPDLVQYPALARQVLSRMESLAVSNP